MGGGKAPAPALHPPAALFHASFNLLKCKLRWAKLVKLQQRLVLHHLDVVPVDYHGSAVQFAVAVLSGAEPNRFNKYGL